MPQHVDSSRVVYMMRARLSDYQMPPSSVAFIRSQLPRSDEAKRVPRFMVVWRRRLFLSPHSSLSPTYIFLLAP